MATTVGLLVLASKSAGFSAAATSLKVGEFRGLATPDAFEASSCSVGLASANCHSPASLVREIFQELVATGKVAAMERTLSILKKSLSSHCSGLGSMLARASEG